MERLLDRTLLGASDPELGTCWLFTGVTTPYGRIAKAQDSYTHRLGWKLLRGPIPEGKELHHRCSVYACWNPEHLEPVTHAENLAYRRKTHCNRGHPLSGANLRVGPTGTRTCRQCFRENQRRFRAVAGSRTSDPGAAPIPGRPGRPPGSPRSDLERLIDRTVLGPTHPELGPIPDGKELHHRCGVHACWNPAHLAIVSHAENLRPGGAKRQLKEMPHIADKIRYVNSQ